MVPHLLLDLFVIEALRLEKSWNVSQRIMLGIPRNSHRFFNEPLSDTKHITFSLFKRYIKFVDSIESSTKSVLRRILFFVRPDCRSNTGQNLRKQVLMTWRKAIWRSDLQPNSSRLRMESKASGRTNWNEKRNYGCRDSYFRRDQRNPYVHRYLTFQN